jgi:phage tail-like protein
MRTKVFVSLVMTACALGSSIAVAAPNAPGPVRVEAPSTLRVKWDNRVVAGITYVSPLGRKTEIVENRSGGDTNSVRRSPGRTSMPLLVLRRPRSAATEFERWAAKVWSYASGPGGEVSLADYRKDLVLDVIEGGKLTASYRVYRCWPAEYTPLADATTENPAGFEILSLACEGWERDASVR